MIDIIIAPPLHSLLQLLLIEMHRYVCHQAKDSRANIELNKNGTPGWSAEDIYIRSHLLFSTLSFLPMSV